MTKNAEFDELYRKLWEAEVQEREKGEEAESIRKELRRELVDQCVEWICSQENKDAFTVKLGINELLAKLSPLGL